MTARLISGSVSFAFDGATAETHVLSPGDPPVMLATPSGRCSAGGLQMTIGPSPNGGGEDVWPGTLLVECEPTAGSLQINTPLVDRRMIGAGTYTFPTVGQPQLLFVSGSCGTGSNGSDRGNTTLTITRAAGRAAPYPDAVTPDYLREFSIHVESEVHAQTNSAVGGCVTPAISTTADLQFVESAADAVNAPDARCLCQ